MIHIYFNTYSSVGKVILSTLICRTYVSNFKFVPKCIPVKTEDLIKLREFIDTNNQICILTGAGVSTESGIPDYRSEGVGSYARSNHRPVLYKDFCEKEEVRRRYWARNYVGWPRFSSFKPNDTHILLKQLEDIGKVKCIVTQNVDNLHTKAGCKNVIELHGTAYKVICLNCSHKISRFGLQKIFAELNPSMNIVAKMIRPDGDVELSVEQMEQFNVPPCKKCGGILKPDIVFFGDNVSRHIVENVQKNVQNSSSLLILGTTLTTYSGYRIVLQAIEAGKRVAIVNIGETRADSLAHIKIEGRCGDVLPKVLMPQN